MGSKADIWMPLYIGDYLADTVMLDAEQSGCYLHWLMCYWRTGPLEDDLEALILIGKLKNLTTASSTAQALLKKFFKQEEDGKWHQKRIDTEMVQWRDKRQKAKDKASKGGIALKNLRSASSTSQAVLNECPSPSPSSREKNKDEEVPIRPEEYVNVWNLNRGVLPRVEGFSDSRRRKVKTRMAQGISLERFTEAIKCCTEKPFLRGENDSGWIATFDWLIENDRNIEKAITNPYGSRNGNGNRAKPKTKWVAGDPDNPEDWAAATHPDWEASQ